MDTSRSPSAHTQKLPHPALSRASCEPRAACRRAALPVGLCLAGWPRTGLPEMAPGQATDGNPTAQATQTVAASCLQVLQALPPPHPGHPHRDRRSLFSARWKPQISFWGLWLGDHRGNSLVRPPEAHRGGQRDGGSGGERMAARRPCGSSGIYFLPQP